MDNTRTGDACTSATLAATNQVGGRATSDAAPAAERRATAQMVAGGLLLGTLGAFVEEAGQHPLTTVWFRCAFGLLALLLWGAARGRLGELRLGRAALAAALGAGLLMVLNWALFFAALARTSIAVATVVFHVQPLWVIALGAWWLREPLSRRQLAAALVALCGLALACGLLEQRAGHAYDASYLIGLAFCLGGSLCYAGVTLIAKCRHAPGSYALAAWQCAVGTGVLLSWPLLHGWPAWGPAWGWLAGLGIVHTGLAYVVLYAGIARLPAGRVAVLQFVYPAAAVLLDWLVYGRALSPLQLAGVALMGAALWQARPAPATASALARAGAPAGSA